MSAVKVIMWLLSNASTIYAIIKQIMDLINNLDGEDKAKAKDELRSVSMHMKNSKEFDPLLNYKKRLESRVSRK